MMILSSIFLEMTELLVLTPDLSYTALTSGYLAPVDLFLSLHVNNIVVNIPMTQLTVLNA